MSTLVEDELVRISRLLREPGEYDGWRVSQRDPAVGDVGTLLDTLHAVGDRDRYVVECSGTDGMTIWLGDFDADELEPVTSEGV